MRLYFYIAVGAIALLLVVAAVQIIQAFNPPTQPPPNGSGALSISGDSSSLTFSASGNASISARSGGATAATSTLWALANAGAVGTATANPFSIRTGGTDKITVLNNGNVGIGVSAPGAMLQIGDAGVNNGAYNLRVTKGSAAGAFAGGYATEFRSYAGGVSGNNGVLINHQESVAGRHILDISNANGIVATFDGNGRVGIGTTAPSQALDVIGYVRGSTGLCIGNNCKTSWPGDGSPTTLWGENRPNVGVVNSVGECIIGGLRVSRSNRMAHWDGAAAACPGGWWVCTRAQRGTSNCGSGNLDIISCDTRDGVTDELIRTTGDWAWLADSGGSYTGRVTTVTGIESIDEVCAMAPVWCCAP